LNGVTLPPNLPWPFSSRNSDEPPGSPAEAAASVQRPVAAGCYGAGRAAGTAAAAGIPPLLVYDPDVEQVLARAYQILWEARAWNGHAG
jgi:hypothetical protein